MKHRKVKKSSPVWRRPSPRFARPASPPVPAPLLRHAEAKKKKNAEWTKNETYTVRIAMANENNACTHQRNSSLSSIPCQFLLAALPTDLFLFLQVKVGRCNPPSVPPSLPPSFRFSHQERFVRVDIGPASTKWLKYPMAPWCFTSNPQPKPNLDRVG